MGVEDDGGMAHPNDVAVGELPRLDGGAVDRSAVGRAEVMHDSHLTVEIDVDVAAGDGGVRQPERCVLTAAENVGTALELISTIRSVVDAQHGLQVRLRLLGVGRWCAVALAVVGLTVLRSRWLALWPAITRLGITAGRAVAVAVIGMRLRRLAVGVRHRAAVLAGLVVPGRRWLLTVGWIIGRLRARRWIRRLPADGWLPVAGLPVGGFCIAGLSVARLSRAGRAGLLVGWRVRRWESSAGSGRRAPSGGRLAIFRLLCPFRLLTAFWLLTPFGLVNGSR